MKKLKGLEQLLDYTDCNNTYYLYTVEKGELIAHSSDGNKNLGLLTQELIDQEIKEVESFFSNLL